MWGVEPVTQPWSSDGEPSRDGLADTAVTSQAIRIRLGELLDAWIALHGNIAQPAPSPEKATREEMSELLDRARGVQQALFLRQVALEYDTAVRRGDRSTAKAVEEWAAGQEGAPSILRRSVGGSNEQPIRATSKDLAGQGTASGGNMKGSIRLRGKTHTAYWWVPDPGTGSRCPALEGRFSHSKGRTGALERDPRQSPSERVGIRQEDDGRTATR